MHTFSGTQTGLPAAESISHGRNENTLATANDIHFEHWPITGRAQGSWRWRVGLLCADALDICTINLLRYVYLIQGGKRVCNLMWI